VNRTFSDVSRKGAESIANPAQNAAFKIFFRDVRGGVSALFNGPEPLGLVPDLKQPVLRVVTFAATGAGEVLVPASAPAIIGFVYNKSCTAAARHHEKTRLVVASDNG
jgi:hypothetical protein